MDSLKSNECRSIGDEACCSFWRKVWIRLKPISAAGRGAFLRVSADVIMYLMECYRASVRRHSLWRNGRGSPSGPRVPKRVVYMRSRDAGKIFDRMFSYAVGPRGVEPKLKFRLEPIEGLTETDLSIAKITERIILGPSLSSPLALATVGKMLDSLGLAELKPRVIASTIPFRAG